MTHGSAGTFHIDLTAGTGIECRSSAAGTCQLVLTFSNNLAHVCSASVSCGSVSSSAIGPNLNQYTINLTGLSSCNAQYDTVTLTNVNDSVGNHSDTVVSPRWGLLIGDVTGDGAVTPADVSQTRADIGHVVTSSNFREDVAIDGNINNQDVTVIKSGSGTVLPP